MKHYKIISLIALILFIVGCSQTTYKEVGFTMPVLKVQPRLMYPKEAQEKDYEGTSKVYLSIAKDGTVDNVVLLESSGYDVLDNAALDYCKKLVFKPAEKEGEPINCKISQKVIFDFQETNYEAKSYVFELRNMYKAEKIASLARKKEIQNEILNQHNKFVKEMDDVLNFNGVLKEVLLEDTYSNWKDSWDRWPLSFLLYHDFIKRYPDYDSLDTVVKKLQSALESDISFILNTKTYEEDLKEQKMGLISKIKLFIKKNYPSISAKIFEMKSPINT